MGEFTKNELWHWYHPFTSIRKWLKHTHKISAEHNLHIVSAILAKNDYRHYHYKMYTLIKEALCPFFCYLLKVIGCTRTG